MSLAETAELAVLLKLKDQLSPGLRTAKSEIGSLEQSASRSSSGALTRFKTATQGMGGALGHAAHQLKGLAMGFGLAAGVVGGASVVGFFTSGIDKARDFGMEVSKLAKITGQSIDATSELASTLDHFGISSDKAVKSFGMLEKNLGMIERTKGGIVGFEKSFGISVRDANGHIKDANDLLYTASDYFLNKHIPATTKAAALAKLFGRSWQDLIPVLGQGSKKLKDAADEAKALGLTVSGKNVDDLAKLKSATRDWGTALGGLQMQIGLLLVGPLTDLTKWATGFIKDPNNRRSILGFFNSVIDVGKTVGGILSNTVLPAIGDLASSAGKAWSGIPGPMRDLLVKAVAGDRVMKFAFGFSPIEFATKGLAGALGGALGGLFQRGGSPANAMWVQSVGGLGGGGGVGGAAGKGAGIMSAISKVFLVGAAVGVAAELWGVKEQQTAANVAQEKALGAQTSGFASTATQPELENALKGVRDSMDKLNNSWSPEGLAYALNIDGVRDSVKGVESKLDAQLTAAYDTRSEAIAQSRALAALKDKQAEAIVAFRAAERTFATQKPPTVNVSTGFSVKVNVTANSVTRSIAVANRIGVGTSSRNSSGGKGNAAR